MKEDDIQIAGLLETRIGRNQKEARGEYTWFLSGGSKTIEEKYTARVGFVINNKFMKFVEDIIPHTDRLIQIKVKGSCEINIVNLYLAPASREEREKETIYQALEKLITTKRKGTHMLNRKLECYNAENPRGAGSIWKVDPGAGQN